MQSQTDKSLLVISLFFSKKQCRKNRLPTAGHWVNTAATCRKERGPSSRKMLRQQKDEERKESCMQR